MSATTTHEMIDVQALQVGMVVHLEGGWMAHPFPLSRFRIVSADQIATIRSLGLKRVRWDPRASEIVTGNGGLTDSSRGTQAPPPATAPATPAAPPAAQPAPDPAPVAVSAEEQARANHRRHLARQREALSVCQRQFSEATQACNEITRLVPAKPQEAGGQAQALSRALVDKMLGEQDMCIQLLGSTDGHKASAHPLNVAVMSLLLGRKIGLDDNQMLDLGVGALLHDIGKLDLPDRVRHRETHLIPAELRHYEEHVAHGVTQARKMGLAPGATLVVAQHHEHSDSSGFPLRLTGEKLSLPARIVALVNRYDNLCNPNLAAKAMTPHESLALMFAAQASRFDPVVLGHFIKMLGVYPPGSTVQLSDGRHALVVNVNSTRPLKPRVLVHDARVPREEALVLDLQTRADLSIRRSVKPLHLPAAALDYLSPAPRIVYFFEPAQLTADEPALQTGATS